MEFCPHGARLVIDQHGHIVLIDECEVCSETLAAINLKEPVAA